MDDLLANMTGLSPFIGPEAIAALRLPDPEGAASIALARHARCPIVSGNIRHFPKHAGIEALTPAECLAKIIGAGHKK